MYEWINPWTALFTSVRIIFRFVCKLSDEIHKGNTSEARMQTPTGPVLSPVFNSCWLNNLSERRCAISARPLSGERTKVDVTQFYLGWLKTDDGRCCKFWLCCHMPSVFFGFVLFFLYFGAPHSPNRAVTSAGLQVIFSKLINDSSGLTQTKSVMLCSPAGGQRSRPCNGLRPCWGKSADGWGDYIPLLLHSRTVPVCNWWDGRWQDARRVPLPASRPPTSIPHPFASPHSFN